MCVKRVLASIFLLFYISLIINAGKPYSFLSTNYLNHRHIIQLYNEKGKIKLLLLKRKRKSDEILFLVMSFEVFERLSYLNLGEYRFKYYLCLRCRSPVSIRLGVWECLYSNKRWKYKDHKNIKITFAFSRGSSQPRNWTQVSLIAAGFFTNWVINISKTSIKYEHIKIMIEIKLHIGSLKLYSSLITF